MSDFVKPKFDIGARVATFAMIAMLTSCAASRPAPVSDARPAPIIESSAVKPGISTAAGGDVANPADSPRMHTVQRSETLYSIALLYGLDYRELAGWNNIVNPAVIRAGDILRISAPGASTAVATATPLPQPGMPIATPLVTAPGDAPVPEGNPLANTGQMKIEPKAGRVPYSDAAYTRMLAETGAGTAVAPPDTANAGTQTPATLAGNDNIVWSWPVKGKLLSSFTETSKGIDIAGSRNAPVFAAAPGKVIYNQSAIRGYGRLVIIKHSENWISAYAHNEKVLVNMDEMVKKGQKIAEMGSSDTDTVKLHFEIRSKGKPVDPLKFLPAQ